MQFANQAISLFISGVFCLVWVGILGFFFGESYVLEFVASVKNATNANVYMIFFTFFVFPLAYAIGSGVNAAANKIFALKDEKIRRKAFTVSLNPEKRDTVYEEICGYFNDISIDNLSKIRRLYHHFRYILYHSGSDIYNYLIFHREIIRILRATCFNFALIFLSLIAILVKLETVHYYSLIYFLIVFSFFISSLCFYAWKNQQENFYVTIISAWVALDMENKNKSQKLQAI